VDEDEILEHLATEETPEFLGILRMPWTDRRTLDTYALERDIARVERYYQARGYYDARVDSSQVIPVDPEEIDPVDNLPEEVDVEIHVIEGRPVRVRSIRLLGTENLDPALVRRLEGIRRLEVGERFDERDYDRQKAALTNVLLDAGYARAKVTGEARVDPPRYRADVAYTLAPGVLCTIGEIKVEGLEDVNEDRVRAVLYLEEGQSYAASDLVQAQRDVYELGVFSSVDVRPDLDAPGSIIPVVITVQETTFARIRGGGGAQSSSQEFDVHLLAGWQHRNLGGELQSIDVEDKPAYLIRPSILNPQPDQFRFRNRLEVNFRWPGLIEERTALLHTGTYAFGPPPGKDFAELDVHDVRLVQGFDRPLTRWLTGALLYHFDFALKARDQSPDDTKVFRDYLTTWLEQSLVADFRDSIVLTRRGVLLSGSVGEKPDFFIGEADFIRLMGEARVFAPVVGPLHFAARLTGGRLYPLSTTSFRQMPQVLLNDFTSGGPNSNRGYPFRSIRPLTCLDHCLPPPEDPNPDDDVVPEDPDGPSDELVGGLKLWEASAELRLDLAGPFRLVGFVDASDAFLPREGFDWGRHHLSTGPGLRWDSILGAIRVDLGFRLPTRRHPDEKVSPFPIFGWRPSMELSLGIGDAF
jgi:outer membrane protein insertion porin family/translocation and assembly module TamA